MAGQRIGDGSDEAKAVVVPFIKRMQQAVGNDKSLGSLGFLVMNNQLAAHLQAQGHTPMNMSTDEVQTALSQISDDELARLAHAAPMLSSLENAPTAQAAEASSPSIDH
jgi:hypothetical protein